MEEIRNFKKVERGYHSTPHGWRLATFEEAQNGLEIIKGQGLLNIWDRARLLDGWISGPGYDYEMGNDFRSCMGYMLLIQTQTSTELTSGVPYAEVKLSESGKEVALLLCVDDWNYEVVYWVLNCWSKSETMNLGDVIEGNIPFSNMAKFKEMNKMLGYVARRLGEEEGAVLEKAGMTKYSGRDSVKEVLSGMIKIVTEEKDIEQLIGDQMSHFRQYGGDEYRLPVSAETGYFPEAFWSFVCDTFAGNVIEVCALTSLLYIRKMKKTKSSKEKNFMIATSILLYLSDFRTHIIHEPLAHRCKNSCAEKILSYAAEETAGDPYSFNEMLKHNAMWRCYNDRGNYGVLNMLLVIVVKGKYNNNIQGGEKIAVSVADMLLKCGAQPLECYAIGKYRKKTALHFAAKVLVEDLGMKFAQVLLDRCDENSIYDFVNAADERGRTALHRASEKGNARICGLLVEFGASLTAQDRKGKTALHYALEGKGIDKVINVFMKSPHVTESLDFKDNSGCIPLDIAVANMDYESTAKLLSKTKEPEAYLSNVDQEQLLRYCLLLGSVDIVYKLYEKGIRLPAGDCDAEGKTDLHLAAMGDDESTAFKIISLKRMGPTPGNFENMVVKQDRKGRTVLHEAALKGHARLCEYLLHINPELIYMKDRDGRNPLYDVAKGKYEGTSLHRLFSAFSRKGKTEEDLIDRRGLTLLHVAASQGKAELVKTLLSSDKIKALFLSRGDNLAQTALHKAVKRGDIVTVEILLNHGAHPLRERDCNGRTALHCVVHAETGDKIELANALFRGCESPEEKTLLLWASAEGLGTADQNLSNTDPLHKFLLLEKRKMKGRNLLQMAASLGYIEMAKELISRGYQIRDIRDPKWMEGLTNAQKWNVERVLMQLEIIPERGNDHPSLSDDLGRSDYACGLAALFLSPEIKPPITVGISGAWGMGKSSLMLQTQSILLTTAAQMALLPLSELSSSALQLPPNMEILELSEKGIKKYDEIERQMNCGQKSGYSLADFLNKYDIKYHKIFKSLAAMDASDMFITNANLPAVLTVQYNAWMYKNNTEALAGMAVEITRELEGIMTHAQWLSTCWRNTWKKEKHNLLIEFFFPCLLALVLACSFTWIAWVVFGSDKLKEWANVKYVWPPITAVILVWKITKSVTGVLKPVSSQLVNYISLPDHTDKLGYQARVISDIKFLKQEIGKEPYGVFTAFVWVFNTIAFLWRLITESWLVSHSSYLEREIQVPKVGPAPETNLRIIVFVDDLDRCEESVILQVLSAINLVLAQCGISVVLSMDKEMVQKAIVKKYGDVKYNKCLKGRQELADKYLQKIIQLPLDLPYPSEIESRRFLEVQLGMFTKGIKDHGSASETYADGKITSNPAHDKGSIESRLLREDEVPSQRMVAGEFTINVKTASEITEPRPASSNDIDTFQTGKEAHSETDEDAGNENSTPVLISDVRNLLFVRYNSGELDAFCYFHMLTTGSRLFLPRGWKIILNYHGLVRNILCLNNEVRNVNGWTVQLIAWIFMCWEWEENMNIIIEKWNEIGHLKTSESNDSSLLMIVEHLLEEHERENMKTTATRNEETQCSSTGKLVKLNENVEGKIANLTNVENDIAKSTDDTENREKASSQKLAKDLKNKLDALEKSLVELKKEMRGFKEVVSDELKNDINEIKEKIVKKHNGKNQRNMENQKKYNLQNWKRMRIALEKYDVSMDGIRAFQRFRFYCIPGYLSRLWLRG